MLGLAVEYRCKKGWRNKVQSPVSIQTKQAFLQWFVTHHGDGNPELDWFIRELIADERALFYVHFVDTIQYCPKGMILDVTNGKHISFRFFKEHIESDDVYTAYHELNLYHQEAFFIHIQFPNNLRPKLYETVLENNQSYDYDIQEETDNLLDYLLANGKEKYVKQEIDLALENGDKERFYYLSLLLQGQGIEKRK